MFCKQETDFLVDEAGKKLQAKLVVMCQMTPFVIMKEGDVNHFAGGKMEDITRQMTGISIFLRGR